MSPDLLKKMPSSITKKQLELSTFLRKIATLVATETAENLPTELNCGRLLGSIMDCNNATDTATQELCRLVTFRRDSKFGFK